MKYVIHWNHERIDYIYFMAVQFKSRHTDTYGSTPEMIVLNTAHLSEAMLFDTREQAKKFIDAKLQNTNQLPAGIAEVTDKELFKARLSDNKIF